MSLASHYSAVPHLMRDHLEAGSDPASSAGHLQCLCKLLINQNMPKSAHGIFYIYSGVAHGKSDLYRRDPRLAAPCCPASKWARVRSHGKIQYSSFGVFRNPRRICTSSSARAQAKAMEASMEKRTYSTTQSELVRFGDGDSSLLRPRIKCGAAECREENT